MDFYAREGHNHCENIRVEDGIVVLHYIQHTFFGFRSYDRSKLVGQPKSALQALDFEPVPGPMVFRLMKGGWISEPFEEVEREYEQWKRQVLAETFLFSGSTLEIHVPKIAPTLGEKDWFRVEKWFVKEGDVVKQGTFLVSFECALCIWTIGLDISVTQPYRVTRLLVPAGDPTSLGALLLTLEPESEKEEDKGNNR